MFEAAQSREEYYKLLAQKIYLIRKELEDRKRNKSRGMHREMYSGCSLAHYEVFIFVYKKKSFCVSVN